MYSNHQLKIYNCTNVSMKSHPSRSILTYGVEWRMWRWCWWYILVAHWRPCRGVCMPHFASLSRSCSLGCPCSRSKVQTVFGLSVDGIKSGVIVFSSSAMSHDIKWLFALQSTHRLLALQVGGWQLLYSTFCLLPIASSNVSQNF